MVLVSVYCNNYIAGSDYLFGTHIGVFVSLMVLSGPLAQVKMDNPLLFRKFTAECKKLGFLETKVCKFYIISVIYKSLHSMYLHVFVPSYV